jgi:SsrA-binding protein
MAGKNKKKKTVDGVVASNRRARFDYEILDEWEAGLCLQGTEVKSLRTGKANIQDSYAEVNDGEVFLINAYIPEYGKAGQFNHETRRTRKLLLNKQEINRVVGKLHKSGLTLVPLKVYFNAKGKAKIVIALAKGKTKYDKRETERRKAWEKEKTKVLRENQ